jgi:hypothetical protein
MITILNDPAGITGRQTFLVDYTASLQDNIRLCMPGGGADCTLMINGQTVDPLTDPRLDVPPSGTDTICIIRRPAGGEVLLYALTAVLVVASLALVPKQPGEQVLNDSPNNRLTGQSNIARTYQAIPDVYGLRRVWPDLIQPSSVEYINHVKYVTEWMCVSRGKGTVTEVRYAETPIDDIAGASYSIFEPAATPSAYPELNTTTIPNVIETFESPDVNGQELPYAVAPGTLLTSGPAAMDTTIATGTFAVTMTDGSYLDELKTRVGGSVYVWENVFGLSDACTLVSFTTSGSNVTFNFSAASHVFAVTQTGYSVFINIEIGGFTPGTTTVGPFTMPLESEGLRYNIVFLRGLKGTVEITAEWWQIDSGGAEISGTRQTRDEEFTADTFDQRFFTRQVFPSTGLGRYRIQFTRTSTASADGSDVAKLEEVYAVRRYATKTLPGVTVVRVTTQATEQATGIKDRRFNLRWNRHVRTLASTTLSPSRNFARAMAHLWCVAGENIAELDTTTLADINTALGETSPLLRFDGTLDDADMSLGERLQRIAYTARCALWRDGSQWTVTREEERTTPDLQLDYRNLAASGDSVITYAAHLPASHNGVEVEYTDETTQASKAYVRLDVTSGAVVSGVPTNPVKIKLPGCATTAQATNRANLEARRLLYQRTTVTDTALQDAATLGLGSLVRWIDPNDFAGDDGLQAGEVMSIAGTLITTSEPLDWRGETTGRMVFTGIDGLPLGSPIVVTPHVSGGVTLASVPGGLYLRDADRQCGSRYAFGPGLSAAEIEAAGLYVATRVAPNGDGTVSIALAAYDARMFDAD